MKKLKLKKKKKQKGLAQHSDYCRCKDCNGDFLKKDFEKGKEIKEKKTGKDGDSELSNSKPVSQQESIPGLSKEEIDTELAERLKEAWNLGKGELNPKVLSMEPGTLRFKTTVKAMRNPSFSKNYLKAIAQIKESDFLAGMNGGWVANFDWFVKSGSIVKIIEGNFKTLVKKDEGFIPGDDKDIKDAELKLIKSKAGGIGMENCLKVTIR